MRQFTRYLPWICFLILCLCTACARKDVNRNGKIKLRGEKPVATQSKKEGDLLQRGLASWYGVPYHGRQTSSGEIYDMELKTAAHKTLPFGTILKVVDNATGKHVFVRINDRGPFVRGRIIDLSKGAARELDLVRRGTTEVSLYLASVDDLARSDERPLEKPRSEARAEPPKPRPTATPIPRNMPNPEPRKPAATSGGEGDVIFAPDEIIEEEILEPGAEVESPRPPPRITKHTSASSPASNYWTVQVGSFSTRDRAEAMVLQMQAYDTHAFLVEGEGLWRVRVGRYSRRNDADALAKRLADDAIQTWVTHIP